MTDAMLGWIIILGLSCSSAALCHALISSSMIATTISVLASVIGLQVINYFYVGYLDPFWIIAVITSSLVALICAIGVGAVVRGVKKARSGEQRV